MSWRPDPMTIAPPRVGEAGVASMATTSCQKSSSVQSSPTESRSSDRQLKPLPPDPFCHQNSAIAPRLHGEGYRKLWARLRFAGVRASPRRVRRVKSSAAASLIPAQVKPVIPSANRRTKFTRGFIALLSCGRLVAAIDPLRRGCVRERGRKVRGIDGPAQGRRRRQVDARKHCFSG